MKEPVKKTGRTLKKKKTPGKRKSSAKVEPVIVKPIETLSFKSFEDVERFLESKRNPLDSESRVLDPRLTVQVMFEVLFREDPLLGLLYLRCGGDKTEMLQMIEIAKKSDTAKDRRNYFRISEFFNTLYGVIHSQSLLSGEGNFLSAKTLGTAAYHRFFRGVIVQERSKQIRSDFVIALKASFDKYQKNYEQLLKSLLDQFSIGKRGSIDKFRVMYTLMSQEVVHATNIAACLFDFCKAAIAVSSLDTHGEILSKWEKI